MKRSPILRLGRLLRATFVERENRYRGVVNISGSLERCYIPDPGRGKELFVNGAEVRIRPESNPKRKTRYTLLIIKHKGVWVSVDTSAPTRLLHKVLIERGIPDLEQFTEVKREPRVGHHRLDFLLRNNDITAYVEVKSVTLVQNGIARFPDAPTLRGTRHLDLLATLSKKGFQTYIFFLVQRNDARLICPNFNTDSDFSAALLRALAKGVTPIAYTTQIDTKGMILFRRIPVLHQGTNFQENSGSYQLVIHIEEDSTFTSGKFRGRGVPTGYYIYTSSAVRNLYQRIARHLQARDKIHHWHIDHLLTLKNARIIDVLIHPSTTRRECTLNRELMRIPRVEVPFHGFGSSDCQKKCLSHLTYFKHLPDQFLRRLPKSGDNFL